MQLTCGARELPFEPARTASQNLQSRRVAPESAVLHAVSIDHTVAIAAPRVSRVASEPRLEKILEERRAERGGAPRAPPPDINPRRYQIRL